MRKTDGVLTAGRLRGLLRGLPAGTPVSLSVRVPWSMLDGLFPGASPADLEIGMSGAEQDACMSSCRCIRCTPDLVSAVCTEDRT